MKGIFRVLSVAVIAVGGIFLVGCDQTPEQANGATPERQAQVTAAAMSAIQAQAGGGGGGIVVVDLDEVARKVGYTDVLNRNLEKYRDQLVQRLRAGATNLQDQVDQKREEFGDEPTEEQQTQLAQMALRARQMLNQAQNQAQRMVNQRRNELLVEFRRNVEPIVQKVARNQGASVAFTLNPTVAWHDAGIDVTAEVVEAYKADPPPEPRFEGLPDPADTDAGAGNAG